MASVSFSKSSGKRTIQFVDGNRRRRTVRLGNVTEEYADKIKTEVEQLNSCAISGKAWNNETAKFVRLLEPTLYDKLALVDLLPPRPRNGQTTLGQWLKILFELRSDVKPSTKTIWGHTRRCLLDFFGPSKQIESITALDADAFRIWATQHARKLAGKKRLQQSDSDSDVPLAKSTVSTRCRLARQFFQAAVRQRLISENPFAELKGVTTQANRERDFHVTRDMADAVLAACPTAEWKLIFALSRFGGLRSPSEIVALRWGDIDWQRGRFTVRSSKTEHHEGKGWRVVPIFPELVTHLQAVLDELMVEFDPKARRLSEQPVIASNADGTVNWRTYLLRIIKAAGLEPWPKLFQNLRATRQTELEEIYPSHVVCAWLGNSERTARKHYLQVTDAHFGQASGQRAALALQSGGVWPVSSRTKQQGELKSPKNCDTVRNHTAKNGRDRTRICDLLHVKRGGRKAFAAEAP